IRNQRGPAIKRAYWFVFCRPARSNPAPCLRSKMEPMPVKIAATVVAGEPGEATTLGQISPQQWRSGIAAWLGWTFDGLDMHLYTLVYAPFVAQLLGLVNHRDTTVRRHHSV